MFPLHLALPPADVQDKGALWLVCQYKAGGSLDDYLKNNPELSNEQLASILLDVAEALAICHKLRAIHRDKAARNVLVDDTGRAFLCDFGLACTLNQYWDAATFPIFTWAPEAVCDNQYSYAADIWSFGLLIGELMHRSPAHPKGREPFLSGGVGHDQVRALFRGILHHPQPFVPRIRGRYGVASVPVTAAAVLAETGLSAYVAVQDLVDEKDDDDNASVYEEVSAAATGGPLDLSSTLDLWLTYVSMPPMDDDMDLFFALSCLARDCCAWKVEHRPTAVQVITILRSVLHRRPS